MLRRILCALVLVTFGVGAVLAQAPDEAVRNAVAEYEEWMKVISDFTRDVTFDERDVRNVIDFWPELDQLEVMQEEEDVDTESPAEFSRDVREILADGEYLSWARGNGLDPESFLKKSMRISSVFMQQQFEGQQAMMDSQRASYEKMVEQSCAQVDADTCAQMRAAMKQSLAMSDAMVKGMESLPKPTAAEAALLEKYGAELEAVMMADDEYDEYEEYYSEDEYYEDEGD